MYTRTFPAERTFRVMKSKLVEMGKVGTMPGVTEHDKNPDLGGTISPYQTDLPTYLHLAYLPFSKPLLSLIFFIKLSPPSQG